MWKKIVGIGVAVVVAVAVIVCLLATRQPDTFKVERSALLSSPPERAYMLVDDFHRWMDWSPWEGLDPAMEREYSGSFQGVGAVYAWKGNSQVGEGRMEILESVPVDHIRIQLDFLSPFEAHNFAEFRFAPEGNGTRVTWTMTGPNNFVSKVMQVFCSMDALVGGDFEKGLANMQVAVQRPAPPPAGLSPSPGL